MLRLLQKMVLITGKQRKINFITVDNFQIKTADVNMLFGSRKFLDNLELLNTRTVIQYYGALTMTHGSLAQSPFFYFLYFDHRLILKKRRFGRQLCYNLLPQRSN